MSRPQVRLDADVAEALQRAADRADTSLSTMANQWLRRALGGATVGITGGRATPAAGPTPAGGRRAGAASITPPAARPRNRGHAPGCPCLMCRAK